MRTSPLVHAIRGKFFENVRPAKQDSFADLQIRQLALTHPEIDRARRAPQLYRKFTLHQQAIACAVNRLLVVVWFSHAQRLRVLSDSNKLLAVTNCKPSADFCHCDSFFNSRTTTEAKSLAGCGSLTRERYCPSLESHE